jgi:hypothetical protein
LTTISQTGGLAFVAYSVEEAQDKLNGRIGSNNQEELDEVDS